MNSRLPAAVLAAGVFLVIVGSRWALIGRYGIDLPEWDQWDAEGLHLLLPWLQNRPILPELFAPHNEHYIVLTKLLNLGVTLANGQWDQRVQCVVNAILPATLALALLVWTRRFLGATGHIASAFLLALLWSLPLGWENALGGFQSQQFFLIGLSLACIVRLPFSTPWSPRWWLGLAAGALALLSMASGLLAPVVVLTLLTTMLGTRAISFRRAWPSLLGAASLATLGWLARHEVVGHASLKAASLHEFVLATARSLQWPVPGAPWFAFLVWAPWIALTIRLLRVRTKNLWQNEGWGLAGLGGWVILQAAAIAYGRGAGGAAPAVRYVDNLILGSLVQLLALMWLARQSAFKARHRGILVGFSVLWLAGFSYGLCTAARQALWSQLPQLAASRHAAILRTRAYLATGKRDYLDSADIPYPGIAAFVHRLAQPELAARMPMSVRPAIALETSAESPGFVRSTSPLEITVDSRANHREPAIVKTSTPAFRHIWSRSRAERPAAAWASKPVAPDPLGGYLVLAVTGVSRQDGTAIELHAAATGRLLAEVPLPAGPVGVWEQTIVPMPTVPFIVQACANSQAWEFAFSEPVAMSTFSYLAWRLVNHAGQIVGTGVALMILAAVSSRRSASAELQL